MTSIRIGNTVVEIGNKTAEEIKAELLRAKNQRLLDELDAVISEFENGTNQDKLKTALAAVNAMVEQGIYPPDALKQIAETFDVDRHDLGNAYNDQFPF
jgi:hypothetical protein